MNEPTQEQLLALWNAFTEFEKKEQTDDEWSSLGGIIETDYGNYGDVAVDSYEYGRRTLLRELRRAINEVQNES